MIETIEQSIQRQMTHRWAETGRRPLFLIMDPDTYERFCVELGASFSELGGTVDGYDGMAIVLTNSDDALCVVADTAAAELQRMRAPRDLAEAKNDD